LALVADAILDCSERGGIVLDALSRQRHDGDRRRWRTGRRCYAMELDPVFVDTAIRRWQALTGGKAHHAAGGRLFDNLRPARRRPPMAYATKADHEVGYGKPRAPSFVKGANSGNPRRRTGRRQDPERPY